MRKRKKLSELTLKDDFMRYRPGLQHSLILFTQI